MTVVAVAIAIALPVAACGARTILPGERETASVSSEDAGADTGEPPRPRPRTLAMSWDQACAIVDGGAVACWGNDANGVAGASADATPFVGPTRVAGLADVIEIALAQIGACALDRRGTVWCWGDPIGSRTPIREIDDAVRVFGSAGSLCALVETGDLWCVQTGFGFSTLPTCGSDVPSSKVGTTISPSNGATDLALGTRHACARRGDGSVACWGCGASGVLGTPILASVDAVDVPGVRAVAVASETSAVCAVGAGGDVTCWGDGSQFGTSLTFAPDTPPRAVPFGAGTFDVDVGVVFTCGAHRDEVTCIGALYDFGSGCNRHEVATRSFAVPGVSEISIGYQDACARAADGSVWCWGCNLTGATGDRSLAGHDSPFRVPL